MSIGDILHPMLRAILDADNHSDDEQIKISEYRSNISAKIFEEGEDFEVLLNRIKDIVRNNV